MKVKMDFFIDMVYSKLCSKCPSWCWMQTSTRFSTFLIACWHISVAIDAMKVSISDFNNPTVFGLFDKHLLYSSPRNKSLGHLSLGIEEPTEKCSFFGNYSASKWFLQSRHCCVACMRSGTLLHQPLNLCLKSTSCR